ncbi:hypothetical protein evm_005881 [Chilo suppressalis]|nr:hypothetical protein evm_005881 [Chilo suppressalis]
MEYIWDRKENFCCLCLSAAVEELIHVEDEVFITFNNKESFVQISELLCSVLNREVLDYLLTFKQVCQLCLQSALRSYIFLKTSLYNSDLLTNTINGLLNSIKNTEEETQSFKTLFVSLNTEDFSSKQFYDVRKRVTSLSMAHHRYKLLDSLKIKSECEKTEETIKSLGNCVVPISTKDMMYDSNSSIIRCKECLKAFFSMLNLRNHYIRVHAPKLYKCTECKKAFGSPSYLETHKAQKHSTIICSECGKTFKNQRSFKCHEMSHLMRFVCQDCGRVYKNKSTFKKHIELNVCSQKTRASPANAKYTCDYCNKKYTQKVSLRVHIQYEHGNYKYHVCNVCNKKFWAQSRLKAHMVKHTKEKNFACSLCDGKFVTKEALLYHTRIHTGEKPYECTGCDARFLSASRRTDHFKRHHTNATLECDICGSKFNSRNYLHKHKRGHFSSNPRANNDSDNIINLTPQKVNEVEFKKLTQELKRFSNEDYNINDQNEIYLEFSNNDGYTISGI